MLIFSLGDLLSARAIPPAAQKPSPANPVCFRKSRRLVLSLMDVPRCFGTERPFAFWPRAEARRKLVYQFQSNRRKPRKRRKRPLCYLCFLLFKKVELETPSSRPPPNPRGILSFSPANRK